MVRERDLNLNVGPNRTEADKHRTGYVKPNLRIGIAVSELPKIREVPVRRARSEILYQQGLTGEILSEVIGVLPSLRTSL